MTARSEDPHHSWLPSSVRVKSDCFHLCLDLQRKSGNLHPRQLSHLLVLLEYWNRRTSTSAAAAAASELPDRALSRHLLCFHLLQRLQHLRVFERCCGCCRPQPTPHPARWLERNLPKLRGAVPGKAAPTRGRSRPLPLQMSENYKIWQQETRRMKQLMAKLGAHWHVYSTDLSLSREPCEWHRHRQVKSFSWKEPDLFAQHLSLRSLENPLMLSSHLLPRWNSLSWLHLRLAPEVPHAAEKQLVFYGILRSDPTKIHLSKASRLEAWDEIFPSLLTLNRMHASCPLYKDHWEYC